MRGALGTVDRPYHIFEWFHHDRFHVLHHMFLQIVFYHTDEATAAIKKKLGPLYKSDPTFSLRGNVAGAPRLPTATT